MRLTYGGYFLPLLLFVNKHFLAFLFGAISLHSEACTPPPPL
jgi:hypothetical protein